MNTKQYNNVIDWTLKHDKAAQTTDTLATARAVFNNMGVALPNGSMQEVYETIKTNQYMGWRACTMEEAQQAANKGTATIGISKDRMVILSAIDEEEPVAETATVMTISENTSAYAVAGLEYYAYSGRKKSYDQDVYNEWIVYNIQNCSDTIIKAAKKNICVAVARTMLSNGYEPAYVAGLLANIVFEGSVGKFESSSYLGENLVNKPDYLVYMDTEYNGVDFYRNNYSGKTIMEVDLQDVWNILEDLKTRSNNTWEIGGTRVGFGLGSIQWTFSRAYSLVCLYKDRVGDSTSITTEQALGAEVSMIMNELQSSQYNGIITQWRNDCVNDMNSEAAAYAAGSLLCRYYLVPKNITEQASKRGLRAREIYLAMYSQ